MSKRKIAIIGAGSVIFCKTLVLDVLATPELSDTEFVLMDLSLDRPNEVKNYIDKVIVDNGLKAKIWVTSDRKEAIQNAKFIITTIQVGGFSAFGFDYKIPMKYGIDQCIGDSMGPGGIFRALRTIPAMLEIAKDVETLAATNALILNYVNPMAMVCWAISTTKANFVGLCHGVQTTLDLISGYVDVPKEEINYLCAGINHMAWFLRIEKEGRDLYPVLRANMEKPEYYVNEKVRGEVFRQTGYMMTESTGHLSEYLPWFRSSQHALELYCDEPAFGGESGAYYNWSSMIAQKFNNRLMLEGEPTKLPSRSMEYGSYIIEAMETGKTFKFNGNIRNNSLISNLPDDCISEMPIYADGTGLHPSRVGNLPPACAALNITNINVQRLGTIAAMEADPELIVMACALDPLTSTKLTIKETRDMVAEMLEAEKKWLPQFEGKTLKKTPIISIPKDVKRAEVPVDPALAILARFGELSK